MYILKEYVYNVYFPYLDVQSRKRKYIMKERNMIIRFLSYPFSDKLMTDIFEDDIILAMSLLKQSRSTVKNISQPTMNRYRSCLNTVFNHAMRQRIVTHNPVKYVKKYQETSRSRYLCKSEAHALLDECKISRNKELYPIVILAIHTGMRFGEITTLTRKNYINKHLMLFGDETKSGKGRLIPLNDDAREVIEQQLRISSPNGRLFYSKDVQTSFKNALQRAGIEGFRFHDIRRTYATYLKYLHVDIHTISKLLGHSTVVMTERYLGTDEKKLVDSVGGLSLYMQKQVN